MGASGRATLAGVADQAVSSATMLALHVVLARLLSPAGFGAFALMVSAAMVGLALVTALVLDPLSVRPRASAAYVGFAAALLAALSLALVPAAAVMDVGEAGRAFAIGLLATPGLGLLMLARRVAYLRGRAGRALMASALWAALCFPALALLAALGAVTAPGAAAVAAGTAGLAGAVLLAGATAWGRRPGRLWRAGLRHHMAFGGWLAAGLPFWMAALHAPLWLLAALVGPEAAGAYRALHLLGMPLVQLASAVGSVHQPRLARQLATVGEGAMRRSARRIAVAVAAPALVWGLLLGAVPGIVAVIFGPPYAAVAALAPLMVAAAALKALAAGPSLALRALRHGRAVFAGTAAGGLCALAGGLAWVPAHGLGGAVAAFAAGAAANLLVLLAALWRRPLAREATA